MSIVAEAQGSPVIITGSSQVFKEPDTILTVAFALTLEVPQVDYNLSIIGK